MFKWLSDLCAPSRVHKQAQIVVEYHPNSVHDGPYHHSYKDERLEISLRINDLVIKSLVQGKWVEVYKWEWWVNRSAFRRGCWEQRLKELYPASVTAFVAEIRAKEEADRQKWLPVDDCD